MEEDKQVGEQAGEDKPIRGPDGKVLPGAVLNPTGIGGLQERPEDINKKGHPGRGWTWKEILEKVSERLKTYNIEGEDTEIFMKEAIALELFNIAFSGERGNVAAIKEIFTRMDGLPRLEVALKGKIDTGSDKIAELLQLMYAQTNSDSKNNSSDVLPE